MKDNQLYDTAHYLGQLRAAEKEANRLGKLLLAAKLDDLERLLSQYRAAVYKVKQLQDRLKPNSKAYDIKPLTILL